MASKSWIWISKSLLLKTISQNSRSKSMVWTLMSFLKYLLDGSHWHEQLPQSIWMDRSSKFSTITSYSFNFDLYVSLLSGMDIFLFFAMASLSPCQCSLTNWQNSPNCRWENKLLQPSRVRAHRINFFRKQLRSMALHHCIKFGPTIYHRQKINSL